MTSHPQTATERFLRHGVAGGWEAAPDVLLPAERYDREWDSSFPGATAIVPIRMTGRPDQRITLVSRVFIHRVILDPALWSCAAEALNWEGYGDEYRNLYGVDLVWKTRWHGLLDHLAAHPGDVEGYLAGIIGGKETK